VPLLTSDYNIWARQFQAADPAYENARWPSDWATAVRISVSELIWRHLAFGTSSAHGNPVPTPILLLGDKSGGTYLELWIKIRAACFLKSTAILVSLGMRCWDLERHPPWLSAIQNYKVYRSQIVVFLSCCSEAWTGLVGDPCCSRSRYALKVMHWQLRVINPNGGRTHLTHTTLSSLHTPALHRRLV